MIFIVSKRNIWTDSLCSMLTNSGINFLFYSDDSYKDDLIKKNPSWVFFFHWSKIVEKDIFSNYRCVVFHTANLPNYRGGSPLQNQIFGGVHSSMVNAIQMTEQIDSGDIYCSKSISLHGSLTDIWMQISKVAHHLILICIKNNPTPKAQIGTPTTLKRLKGSKLLEVMNDESDICQVYDHIRALDAEGYNEACIKVGNFMLSFSRAKLVSGNLMISDVKIRKEIE